MEEKLLSEILLEIIKLNNKVDDFRKENAAEHEKMREENAAEHKKMREENAAEHKKMREENAAEHKKIREEHKKMKEINMVEHQEIMDTLLEIIEIGDRNSQNRIISLEDKVFGKNEGIKLMETTSKYKA